MYINNVKVKNFRNYNNSSFDLKNGMNVLIGPNGVGKTNLLEAIYLLSTTRSHRNNEDREMIQFNQDFAAVEGIVESNEGKNKLDVIIHKKGKTLLVNNLLIKKNSEYVGKLNAVVFSPNDMNLFDSSPRDRRKLVDMEVGKLSSSYMFNLSTYLQCLKERNAYLKNHKNNELLETYTEGLYQPQINIIKERAAFVNAINAYLSYFYNQISNTNSNLQMVYKSFIKEKENSDIMLEEIKEAYSGMLDKDISLQQTNIGIHREDYEFYLNNMSVDKYCSQGQKRMIILAIKLAIVQIIYQIKREYPILLLDDVFSELDSEHRTCLLKLLPNSVQSIITTNDIREVGLLRKNDVNIIKFGNGSK